MVALAAGAAVDHHDGCRSYYEPLNERRWFDPASRGNRIDPTHRGVDDYWREYEGLTELGQWHRADWTIRSLFMDESAWDADLQQYFSRLIESGVTGPSRASM